MTKWYILFHIHNKNLYECLEKYDPREYSISKHINISCDVIDFTTINIESLFSTQFVENN